MHGVVTGHSPAVSCADSEQSIEQRTKAEIKPIQSIGGRQ